MVGASSCVLGLCFGLRSGDFCYNVSSGSCVLNLCVASVLVHVLKSNTKLCDTLVRKLICACRKCNSVAKADFEFFICVLKLRLIYLILRFVNTSRNPAAFWACVLDSVILRSGSNGEQQHSFFALVRNSSAKNPPT